MVCECQRLHCKLGYKEDGKHICYHRWLTHQSEYSQYEHCAVCNKATWTVNGDCMVCRTTKTFNIQLIGKPM